MSKIGLYSGTFDPVHNGHLRLADHAIKELGLQQVWFLPERKPRRKQTVSDILHRIAMLEIASADNESIKIVQLAEDQFTLRGSLALLQSQARSAGLVLLMGSDNVPHLLDAWPDLEQYQSAFSIAVAQRVGHSQDTMAILKKVELRFPELDITLLSRSADDMASSKARSHQSTDVPRQVLEYMKTHALYA